MAVVQIRGDEKIINRVIDEVKEFAPEQGLLITRIDEVKNGYDIHFSSKRAIRNVIKSIRNRYSIKTKITRKFIGIKEGKKVYKDFALVRVSE